MTSPSNPIKNPFDLLDTDANVVPILSKDKLNSMIAEAVTHEQALKPATPKVTWAKTGWWSGGLATAACLILLLTMFPQNTVRQLDQSTPVNTASQSTAATSQTDDTDLEISEMMFYDTLESF